MAKRKSLESHELRKILRQAILDSGKTVYQLHVETRSPDGESGLDQGQLHKFMNDETTDIKASTVERLCKILGLTFSKDETAD